MWLLVVGAAVVVWIISWLASGFYRKKVVEFKVPVRDVTKGHHWILVDAFDHGQYCNKCGMGTFRGAECDFCGIKVDSGCLKAANSSIPCKLLSSPDSNGHFKHHWVHGNLPHGSFCAICEDMCGDGPGLRDYICGWCQACVHEHCFKSMSAVCDLGEVRLLSPSSTSIRPASLTKLKPKPPYVVFKQMIMPPSCVMIKSIGWKGRRQLVVDRVSAPSIPGWSPVIVIANQKSGNGEGDVVLQAFRKILNPAQVVNVARVSPESALRWCHLLKGVQCRVLVAGGDGTVGWVLETIEKLGLNPPPQVGLLSLGTGNDLSRVLGWGAGHSGAVNVAEVLSALARAVPVKLDRWTVSLKQRRHFGIRLPDKKLTMSNYMSIGVDACVTFNMHNSRQNLPRALSSRLINKMLFFTYGTKDVLEHACKDLQDKIELFLDGKKIDLPALEGIVVLNIPYWGAGVKVWEMGDSTGWKKQQIDDGIFEVFGLYSSFHIAQMQVGLSEPLRIGQGNQISLRIFHKGRLPMQVDGEPWQQGPATISIQRKCQASMLACADSTSASPSPTPGDEQNSSDKIFF